MKSASTDFVPPSVEVDVWLDVGQEGRCFSYKDGLDLGVDLGDIVLVRLRGRAMQGLVVGIRSASEHYSTSNTRSVPLVDIELLIQRAAVDSKWSEWIETVAEKCHISHFRMLKAALPSGWIGHKKSRSGQSQMFWWVELIKGKDDFNNLSLKQIKLCRFLLLRGGGAWQRDLSAQGFSSALLRNVISKGYVIRNKRLSVFQEHLALQNSKADEFEPERPRLLTDEQESAMNVFHSQPVGSAMLLWGVTGSGKTEVYLQMAAEQLAEGKHCLILAPEIGLIPQLVDRFTRRFGKQVREYHSSCSVRERIATWQMAQTSSDPLIFVGTRSAVFLPLSPLGLIVLDEEHDSSYKQESPMPCYHARDLALDRAKRIGARVVLGSATPSLSTWKELSPNGSISVAKLTRRISEKPLPKVQVVDMREEFAAGHRKLISRLLMNSLASLPKTGEQAVILVPRRGYSSFLSCRSCGEVVECPQCDVALTVHRRGDGSEWLRCHWCDFRTNIERECKECGSKAFKPFGAGTQRVMEHLSKELEGLRLLRFDKDTTGGRDGHRKLLDQFAAGQADVLIGTQMLAKGIDLPRVTLAAVLAADGLLHRPDLLAGEQSLQLFMQLAGRAGRGELPGKVIVQTYCPDHPVILHLVDGLYEDYLKKEAKIRKEAGLVPYSRACLLRLSGESPSVTATSAASLAEKIRPVCDLNGWSVLGPAPSLIAKVAGKSRWQILLHGPENTCLPLPPCNELWAELPKGVNLSVDPDPMQL